MDAHWMAILDTILADKDVSADITGHQTATERRIGLALRSFPRLISIAASVIAAIGTLLLFVHYGFIVRALPTADIPTLLKLAGIATFGSLLAALTFATLALPGYWCGHWRIHNTGMASSSRLPLSLSFGIFGLGFAGDMLATFVPLLHRWSAILMVAPPYILIFGMCLIKAGRITFKRYLPGLLVGPVAWVVIAYLFSASLVDDVATHDTSFKSARWVTILFVVVLFLIAVLNGAIAHADRSRAWFGAVAVLAMIIVIDPWLLSDAPFRVFRLGDYNAAVQFRDNNVARMMHHRCQLLYTSRNMDGILHIIDSTGPLIMYSCTRFGETRTGFLDPKDVFLTAIDSANH